MSCVQRCSYKTLLLRALARRRRKDGSLSSVQGGAATMNGGLTKSTSQRG